MSRDGRDALIAAVGGFFVVGAVSSYGLPTWAAILFALVRAWSRVSWDGDSSRSTIRKLAIDRLSNARGSTDLRWTQ